MSKRKLYKQPTFRLQPNFFSLEEAENLDVIIDLLEADEAEKLKESGLVKDPKEYSYVVNFYSEWDEEELEEYWAKAFLNTYPTNPSARLLYSQLLFDYEKGIYEVEQIDELLKDEISLFLKGKETGVMYNDGEYKELIFWLSSYFRANDRDEELIELYRCAMGLNDIELMREISFKIHKKEREAIYEEEKDEVLIECLHPILRDLMEVLYAQPKFDLSYLLLNKFTEDLSAGDIKSLTNISELENLEQDLNWVLWAGFIRLVHSRGFYNFDFWYNTLMVAAHYRMYDHLAFYLSLMKSLPADLLSDLVGDIGYEILHQPFSILASEKPEVIEEFIMEVDCEDHIKAIFYEVLCYTYRFSKDQKILAIIQRVWFHAKRNDHELLGYLIYSTIDQEIPGFEEEIKEAYEKNLINLKYFDKVLDMEANTLMRQYDASSLSETNLESMLNAFRLRISSLNEKGGTSQELKDHIENTLKEAIEYDKFMNIRFEQKMDIEFDHLPDLDQILESETNHDPFVRKFEKIGRNNHCPCGSGKKYKKCCLVDN